MVCKWYLNKSCHKKAQHKASAFTFYSDDDALFLQGYAPVSWQSVQSRHVDMSCSNSMDTAALFISVQ